ncbi:MAG TPA: PAS domain-containing protein [Kiritimatiellae bacterium]|nr:PAS domain-containing protein [Kiritimatiellia bacterium]
MKSGFWDKLIERLDRVDPGSVQTHLMRLARERGLLESLLEVIQEGVIALDGDSRIEYANRAAQRMLGVRSGRLEGRELGEFLPGIEWKALMSPRGGSEWSVVLTRRIEVNYPEQRLLDIYVVPLSLVSDRESGAVVIARDVERQREEHSRMIESERLKAITILAGSVAHEIGNPLNSLNIHLQLLQRELEKLEHERRQYLLELLDVARQEVGRLDRIIHQFLRALRPVPLEPKPTDLRKLVEETLAFMRVELENRDVLVEVEAPDKLPAALVDPEQVRQAFYNIVRNAAQAMERGGMLQISLDFTDRFVAVAFRDTGSGISPERMGRLFEPFASSKADGSGLGMLIVQRVVRDHGGEIEIQSRPGRGTSITLFLPREDRRVRLLQAHRRERARSKSRRSTT